MKKSLSNAESVYGKSFPGATTDDMSFYPVPTAQKKPNRIILHTEVNNLNSENDDRKVAEDILTVAEYIKSDRSQIVTSGLINTVDKERSNL